MISGVPQGTVLGPILFLIYINDLELATSSFADDTRISREIQLTEDTEILQSDLNNVIDWSTANNMELHEKNFESLSYRLPANIKRGEQLPGYFTLFGSRGGGGGRCPPLAWPRGGILKSRTGIPIFYK